LIKKKKKFSFIEYEFYDKPNKYFILGCSYEFQIINNVILIGNYNKLILKEIGKYKIYMEDLYYI
jgi:hypothetical protein